MRCLGIFTGRGLCIVDKQRGAVIVAAVVEVGDLSFGVPPARGGGFGGRWGVLVRGFVMCMGEGVGGVARGRFGMAGF